MTMMTDTHVGRPSRNAARLAFEMLQHQIERIRREMRLRRDRRHLREMPDHLLKDIGISRYEIDSVTEYGVSDPTRRRRG
jgi:uncharacterized protein YjiS (DUF1127 family)